VFSTSQVWIYAVKSCLVSGYDTGSDLYDSAWRTVLAPTTNVRRMLNMLLRFVWALIPGADCVGLFFRLRHYIFGCVIVPNQYPGDER
jgi:hypothetical protein